VSIYSRHPYCHLLTPRS